MTLYSPDRQHFGKATLDTLRMGGQSVGHLVSSVRKVVKTIVGTGETIVGVPFDAVKNTSNKLMGKPLDYTFSQAGKARMINGAKEILPHLGKGTAGALMFVPQLPFSLIEDLVRGTGNLMARIANIGKRKEDIAVDLGGDALGNARAARGYAHATRPQMDNLRRQNHQRQQALENQRTTHNEAMQELQEQLNQRNAAVETMQAQLDERTAQMQAMQNTLNAILDRLPAGPAGGGGGAGGGAP